MIFGKKKTTAQQSAGCPPVEAFPPHMTKAESDSSSHQEEEEEEEEKEGEDPVNQQQQPTSTKTATSCSTVETNEYHPIATHDKDDNDDNEKFQRGDHVYQWCSLLGIPGVFQHHGIVIHVEDIVQVDSNGEKIVQQMLTIADFSNLLGATTPTPSSSNGHGNSNDAPEELSSIDDSERIVDDDDNDHDERVKAFEEQATAALPNNNNHHQHVRPSASGSMPLFFRSDSAAASKTSVSMSPSKQGWLRVYTTTSSNDYKWHKVKYQDHWFHTHIWKRSGTCTPAKSDPPEVVLKRVHFLLSCRNESLLLLPSYHAIYANCECVAVWCKTGTWSTLQAASFLSHAAVGQVKGTATIAGIAAAQTVTVPAAGVWGWLGYTTTVPLMTVNPLILPAICAYGAVTIGGPAVCLAMAKSKWKKTTKTLNPALEAECLEVSLVT